MDTTPTDKNITLTDYYADWCGPCRSMKPIIEELKQEYAGKVKFEKVNVDQQVDKANAAGVMSLPTFHLSEGEKVIKALIGYQSKDQLKKEIDSILSR